MGIWTFYDYIEPGGRNPFYEWKSSLIPNAEAMIDARILQMAGLKKWSEKWVSKYRGAEGLFELRISYMKVQYRPFGTYAPRYSFVLLGGGIEKDWKIPRDTIEAIQKRQKLLLDNPHYVRPHRIY